MSAVKIEAFTFEYNELQDRIRMSGNAYNNGIEVHLWLTRRLTLRLLNSAVELIERTSESILKTPVDHRAQMAIFEHENAKLLGENLIETSSQNNSTDSESVKKAEFTDIINRLDISFSKNNYQLSFFVASQEEAIATAVVNYNQLHQLLSLIHKGAKALDWGAPDNLFVTCEQVNTTLQ